MTRWGQHVPAKLILVVTAGEKAHRSPFETMSLWPFSSKKEEESSSEEEEEYSDSELYEEDYVDLRKNMQIYSEDETRTIGKLDMDYFLDNIKIWPFNRPLKNARVNKLKLGIQNSGMLHGMFTIVEFEDDYYLIDGQHRYHALCKLREQNKLNDLLIIICIYVVASEEAIIELFKIINDTCPLDPKESPNIIVARTINRLIKDYHAAIKTTDRTTYPYILASDLKEHLSVIVTENTTVNQLYTAIRKMNGKYSKMRLMKIPNVRTALTKSAVSKAKTAGFYLGLDETWSWVEELEL